MSGLRTIRTAWIRPSTTSTVSTLQTRLSDPAGPPARAAPHELRELLRVDLAGLHARQRLLGRAPLRLPERRLGRAAHHAAGLAVDPHPPQLERAAGGRGCAHRGHEPGDQRGADERLLRRHRLAAAVGVQDGVLREQLLQGRQVALLGGREEALEQGVAGGLVGVEARALASRCLRARDTSCRELTSVRSMISAISRVVVAEHLAQQVGRPLDRRQPLQQHQQGQRQRIRELGARGRAGRRVLEQRLREPRPDVGLAPGPRRLQDVDRQPRRHRRDPGRRLVDRLVLARQAQQRLLGDVLGLRDAAQHPVGHAEAVPPQGLELFIAHRHQ